MFGSETFRLIVQRTWLGDARGRQDNGAPLGPQSQHLAAAQQTAAPSPMSMPDRLRQRAAMADRLAACIPGDRAADDLQTLSIELENQAAAIETASLQSRKLP
jgi:hypothetical protein